MDPTDPQTATSIYNFTVKDTFGTDVRMDKYTGKVVLVVNIASRCALAKINYEQLAKLNELYYEEGLRIVAFPCKQFGEQMPEQNGEDMICHLRNENAEIGDIMAKVESSIIGLFDFRK